MKKHLLLIRAAASLVAQGREVFLRIIPSIPSQKYSAGTRLFSQGSPPRHVYWIDWGLVKLISVDRRGHELLVGLRPAGWILGAASVVVQKRHPVTAVTLIDCQLNRLTAQRFLNLAQTNARFSWVVNQLHSREIHDQVTHIIGLGSLTARRRLEQLLLHWVSSVEPPGTGKAFG